MQRLILELLIFCEHVCNSLACAERAFGIFLLVVNLMMAKGIFIYVYIYTIGVFSHSIAVCLSLHLCLSVCVFCNDDIFYTTNFQPKTHVNCLIHYSYARRSKWNSITKIAASLASACTCLYFKALKHFTIFVRRLLFSLISFFVELYFACTRVIECIELPTDA